MTPDAHALHDLGVRTLQRGDTARGIEFLRRSLEADPHQPFGWCNLGNGLREAGQFAAALGCYSRALQLLPQFPGALYNQANVLLDLDRAQEALESFDRTLLLQPAHADAHNNRGNALLRLGRPEDALESYRRALAARPDFDLALSNFAHLLRRLGRFEEAVAAYARLIAFRPDDVEAIHGRAQALRSLKRQEEALLDFDRACQLAPRSPEILYGRAVLLRELYRHPEAAQGFARVLDVAPDYDYALGNLLHAQLQTCDWNGYPQRLERIEHALSEGKKVYLPGPFVTVARSAAAHLQCARAFIADKYGERPQPFWNAERYQHEKIRVAYISADFREHPVSLLLVGVLERHNRERFETIGISLRAPDGSATGRRIETACSRFIDASRESDRDIARMLRELEADIVVDLTGHSGNARTGVLAYRPAPVQVNYLGYTATMALPTMDYIIADATVVPDEHREHYTEKVVHLPDCYQPSDCERPVSEATPTRTQCGLPESGFVFCCFNAHYKIGPEVFDLWMRLLRAVEGSVLWLAEGSGAAKRNLLEAAARRSVGANRLIFAPRVAEGDAHLARYRVADLFLDTLPFNAHATASDALWAGLPVLTCQGGTFAGRVASSLLLNVGLPELVTSSLQSYEDLALRLTAEPTLLAQLRTRLSSNRKTHALFDTERYCRNLEAAYTVMWERASLGLPPKHMCIQNVYTRPSLV